jgi:hypothetical protein
MLFVEPGEFIATWDISIKVPVIVRNCLPYDIKIRTKKVIDFGIVQKRRDSDSESFCG